MTHIRSIELASRSDLFPVWLVIHFAPSAEWDIRQIEVYSGPNQQGLLDADVAMEDLPISTQALLIAALNDYALNKAAREHGLRRLLADLKAEPIT